MQNGFCVNEFIQQVGATLALEKELTRGGRKLNVVRRSWKSLDSTEMVFHLQKSGVQAKAAQIYERRFSNIL